MLSVRINGTSPVTKLTMCRGKRVKKKIFDSVLVINHTTSSFAGQRLSVLFSRTAGSIFTRRNWNDAVLHKNEGFGGSNNGCRRLGNMPLTPSPKMGVNKQF